MALDHNTTTYRPATQSVSRSSAARTAARNWQRKAHDMAVAGVGFGLLGRGYDVKRTEKEAFFEKYAKMNDEIYNHSSI